MSAFPDFADFFRAIWKKDPFPWQEMLAERVVSGSWPTAIDLPTASGKTACLDIAVYALAAQVGAARRTSARRVWFVVDRRIVVDEAFERAEKLAEALEHPQSNAVRAVAERLLDLRGLPRRERPLAVGRLRGGVLRDDRWARIPSQAAIITSTVDQLGSRLLFRGYGHSALAASIYAGLACNDSLILLDEAHCAIPFLQTVRAVELFRGGEWSEVVNVTPFNVAVLSATPPSEDEDEKIQVFPASDEEREKALKHEALQARLTASKRAVLATAKNHDALAGLIADAAEKLAREGRLRIGVIVNRVARAAQIADVLKGKTREKFLDGTPIAFDVEVLTGRIRPVERDALVGKLHPVLHSSPTKSLARPLILVSTQCLEVGADFSFDALVTECASLDAVRQRFGRLARLGRPENSDAFIFVAEPALKETDPIYGSALAATWKFLWEKATVEPAEKGRETRSVNFGFEALRAILPPPDELKTLLAPSPDAPILLPAHLDLLCQTAPRPHPDPDVGVFLHGKGRNAAEVHVAFRCDLEPERTDDWAEIVSLCPPVAGEMFSVPLHRLRAWLRDPESAGTTSDVEGEENSNDMPGPRRAHLPRFLIYRGRENSALSGDPAEVSSNSIIVLPAPRDEAGVASVKKLGQALCERGFGSQQVDLWELALLQAGKTPKLRIHRESLARWLGESGCPPLRELLELVESEEWTADELRETLANISEWRLEGESASGLPDWLRRLFQETASFRFNDIAQHPGGGIILSAEPKKLGADEPDFFADDDDAPSEAPEFVTLADHSGQVAVAAEELTSACLGENEVSLMSLAGQWHDSGKVDARFQHMLRGGAPDDASQPLAKSPRKPRSREQAKAVEEAVSLPASFRHEMFSIQLAEQFCNETLSEQERELLLHLIASHHGHARPFAPVCEDAAPPGAAAHVSGTTFDLSAENRQQLIPAHRMESAITDRFWTLVRRFGWWGLAHREAILRLADWYASAYPDSSCKKPLHS